MSAIEPKRVVLDSKEAVNEYISNYEKETQSRFIVWSKDKLFGEKDCAPHPKSLVYWESKEGTLIDFSGKPFIRIGRKIFVCHLGPDKNKMQKENNRLKMLNEMQDDRQLEFQKRKRVCKITKKRNCPARIYCSHVIEFLNDSVQISSNTKSRRRLASAKLRELLEKGTAECQNRFHVMTAHSDSHKHDYPLVDTSIPSSINNSKNESTTIELVVGRERGCHNDDERYSIYDEDVPEEVTDQNKYENTEFPVAIPKRTKYQRKAVASSCFEKLRKLQSLLPNLKTNDIAALDTTMDSLLSHMNEMPTKRKQILNSVIESPSTKGRYGLKKKATPERVGTTVYHDQTVNVPISNSSKRGRFMPQHLAIVDNESTQQPRCSSMTASPSPQHIIPSSQGEPDYSEQQILLHNGQTQTVCVTTVFET